MPLLARRSLTLADAKSRRSRAVAWVKDHPFAVEFAEIDLEPANRKRPCLQGLSQ
jgi:hypothetical protein